MIDLILGSLGAAGAALLAALVWWVDRKRQRSKGRSEGKSEAATEAMKDAQNRVESGRKALGSGRSSGKPPDQRVRDNDGKW